MKSDQHEIQIIRYLSTPAVYSSVIMLGPLLAISIEKLRSVENELLQLKFENEDLFAKISYQD